MKPYAKSLMLELERELDHVHLCYEEPTKYSGQAIKILKSKIEMLRLFVVKYNFTNVEEEIDFFKIIKPQFASKLIYYNEVLNIETCKPCGTEKILRKYYKSELEKLKAFFDDNVDFYRYHRAENTHYDSKYFLRGAYDIKLTLESCYFKTDHHFSTSHDFKVARIMANDLIKVYLEYELAKLDSRTIIKQHPVANFKNSCETKNPLNRTI